MNTKQSTSHHTTHQNAVSQIPKKFFARHMQPGTCKYDDEMVLVDTEGVIKLLKTGVGLPVFIGHQKVDLKNIKSQADGYITDSFYNPMDGWGWFEILAIDDKMHEAIRRGLSVSNAYVGTDFGAGGTKNNVPFHREIKDGYFTHLAIVPDPRYEGACVMSPEEFSAYQEAQRKKVERQFKNSKGETTTMKLFKTKREEVNEVDLDASVQLSNGKEITLKEMINSVEKAEKDKPHTVTVNGKEMSIDDLAAAYERLNAKKAKKNESQKMKDDPAKDDVDIEGDQDVEDDDEEGDDKKVSKKNKKSVKKNDMDDMENSDDDDDDDDDEKEEMKKDSKKNKKEKKNSISTLDFREVEKDPEFFNNLRDANRKIEASETPMISSSIDQIERGKQRYGS